MMKWPLEVGLGKFRIEHHYWEKHFPFKLRNQQSCTTRPEKKIELPQNKQIFSSVSGSLERIKQAFLYWSCSRTFMLTSALVPIYAAGFYTSTSGGHSNFRLRTEHLLKRSPASPIPSLGEGKHSRWNLFPNHCSVLEGRISQKVETEIPQREGEKAFSWCEHACEENAFFGGMKPRDERDCLWSPSEGFHSEGACDFLQVPGEEDLVNSWIFKQITFQSKGGTMPTPCK